SQLPLLGSCFSNVGKRASTKNGDANVTEKAKPPSTRWVQVIPEVAAVPPKPPRKGATHAKLMIVNVSAMNMVPTSPPLPSRADVNRAKLLGSSISYMPNRLRAKNTNNAPR